MPDPTKASRKLHRRLFTSEVDPGDYQAALAYLELRLAPDRAARIVERLKHGRLEHRRANDILRACDRDPLPLEDPGVKRALLKVVSGRKLRPVMLVSIDPIGGDIADGYHRVSLAYHLDPFFPVPCKLEDA